MCLEGRSPPPVHSQYHPTKQNTRDPTTIEHSTLFVRIMAQVVPAIIDEADADGCAHVIDASAAEQSSSSSDEHSATWTFSATIASADTGWEKYANLWIVKVSEKANSTTAETVLGERVLLHPHVDEQPFTRSLSGVVVPLHVNVVVIAAQDSVKGFCGAEFSLVLRQEESSSTTVTTVPSSIPNAPTTLGPTPLDTTSSAGRPSFGLMNGTSRLHLPLLLYLVWFVFGRS